MGRKKGPTPLLIVLLVLCGTFPAQAESYQIVPPLGGDCELLGGFWVAGTSTCLLFSFNLGPEHTLTIVQATLQLNGFSINHGAIDNLGTINVAGSMWNYGTLINQSIEDSGIVSVLLLQGDLINLSLLVNEFEALIHAMPGATLLNFGEMVNDNAMIFDIDEVSGTDSGLLNLDTVTSHGMLLGGATQSHPGALLDNRGAFDNTTGVIRNARVDNQGSIEGGLIDDTGGAQAFVINRSSGTIDGAEITKVALDNFGTLDNHTFGSGTIVNHAGAAMRVVGGQSFLVVNRGYIEILNGYEMFNTFTNEASGILVSQGSMLSHALLVNQGLLENRGPWTNDGDETDEGVIENLGTLLNEGVIQSCTQAPDTERVVNLGLLSNGGEVSSCGAANQGRWFECGSGGTPAGDPVIPGADADLDHVCDGVDCADDDPTAWAAPSEVQELTLAQDTSGGSTEFTWSEPWYAGGTAVRYDLLSSSVAQDFSRWGVCLASGLSGNDLTDAAPVESGSVLYFLVRATTCAAGSGGVDSSGIPRELPLCL